MLALPAPPATPTSPADSDIHIGGSSDDVAVPAIADEEHSVASFNFYEDTLSSSDAATSSVHEPAVLAGAGCGPAVVDAPDGDDICIGYASDDSASPAGGVVARSWTHPVTGVTVFFDKYQPKGKPMYRRWMIRCPHHADCLKKRSTTLSSTFGPSEPLSWLLCWITAGSDLLAVPDKAAHFKIVKIPTATVGDYIDDHFSDFCVACGLDISVLDL